VKLQQSLGHISIFGVAQWRHYLQASQSYPWFGDPL